MCDRKNCSIQATHFIPRVGYLCDECIAEFSSNKMFQNVSPENLDDTILKELIDILMGLEKNPVKNEDILKAFFNQYKI